MIIRNPEGEILKEDDGVYLMLELGEAWQEDCEKVELPICRYCNSIISDDPKDYHIIEDTCERGCCHNGWNAYVSNNKTILGNYACDQCYGERYYILKEKVIDRLSQLTESKADRIENKIGFLQKDIKELKKLQWLITELSEKEFVLDKDDVEKISKFTPSTRVYTEFVEAKDGQA
jgi:hypothetical protein